MVQESKLSADIDNQSPEKQLVRDVHEARKKLRRALLELNSVQDPETVPVTAVTFASPRVGDRKFADRCSPCKQTCIPFPPAEKASKGPVCSS